MRANNLQLAIGVDLGGTKIEIGIVDMEGKIHEQVRLKTLVDEGPAAIEMQIVNAIRFMIEKSSYKVLGIGIGVAGQIETNTGLVIFAPNLKWHCYPLQQNIEKSLLIPTLLINDVRVITLAEWKYGAGKGCSDLVCAFIGTGIGGGVVSDGKLLTGASNIFGEIGHMTIDINGPICTCGKQGCFEALAGGWGIAARAKEAVKADKTKEASQILLKLADGKIESITAKHVVEAYRQNDSMAVQLIEAVIKALIAAFASIVNIYNPARLILGGGLIDGMPELISIIKKGIKDCALSAATNSLEVVKAELGKGVGVIGSAALIFNSFQTGDAHAYG